MKSSRWRETWVLALTVLISTSARADKLVKGLQDSLGQRLSVFHDYGFSVAGLSPEPMSDPSEGGLLTHKLALADTDYSGTVAPFSSKSWNIHAGVGGGYDSNPEATLKENSGIFAVGDAGVSYGFHTGSYDDRLGYPALLVLSYNVEGVFYEGGVSQADAMQHTARAQADRWIFDDSMRLSLVLQDQYTYQAGRSLANVLDVTPGVEAFVCPQFSVDLSYNYAYLGYTYNILSAYRDQDADRHTFTILAHFYPKPQVRGYVADEAPDRLTEILRRLVHRVTIGGAYVRNDADGGDWQYTGDRFIFGLQGVQPMRTKDLTLDFLYSREWDHYSNPNDYEREPSKVKPQSFPRRKDHLDVVTVRANARLLELHRGRQVINGFVQALLIDDSSNIGPRSFNEWMVAGGLSMEF